MPVETRSNVDQEIRTLVDGFAKAVREKNLDALMPHYAPELVVFNGRVDGWIRVTVGYRKAGGKWMVTHEHVSMPIDMKTGKVPADLKP